MKRSLLIFSVIVAIALGIVHSAAPLVTDYCTTSAGGSTSGVVANLAPWYCANSDPFITKEWATYFPIMSIAVTLSYTIAAVFFMFGIALKNDKLRTFGISELYEATASAVMVAMFCFIAAVMFGLLPSITVGAINPYDTALSYIAQTTNTTFSALDSMMTTAIVDNAYVSMTITGSILNFNIPPVLEILSLPFFYLYFWPVFSIAGFLFDALVSLYTQFYMIVFFMYAAIPVFLVPGVIFRAFIPTRNLGGMMMAAAIGFYFIMPTLFSVAYYFTSVSIASALGQAQSITNAYGVGPNSLYAASTPGSPLQNAITYYQSAISPYWMSILFFPALILTMTYMMITQMAEILGGMGKTSSKLRALV